MLGKPKNSGPIQTWSALAFAALGLTLSINSVVVAEPTDELRSLKDITTWRQDSPSTMVIIASERSDVNRLNKLIGERCGIANEATFIREHNITVQTVETVEPNCGERLRK